MIAGIVRDSDTGEGVDFAFVRLAADDSLVVQTSVDGVFTADVPEGTLLKVTHAGYSPARASAAMSMDVRLQPIELEEVVITPGDTPSTSNTAAVVGGIGLLLFLLLSGSASSPRR